MSSVEQQIKDYFNELIELVVQNPKKSVNPTLKKKFFYGWTGTVHASIRNIKSTCNKLIQNGRFTDYSQIISAAVFKYDFFIQYIYFFYSIY